VRGHYINHANIPVLRRTRTAQITYTHTLSQAMVTSLWVMYTHFNSQNIIWLANTVSACRWLSCRLSIVKKLNCARYLFLAQLLPTDNVINQNPHSNFPNVRISSISSLAPSPFSVHEHYLAALWPSSHVIKQLRVSWIRFCLPPRNAGTNMHNSYSFYSR